MELSPSSSSHLNSSPSPIVFRLQRVAIRNWSLRKLQRHIEAANSLVELKKIEKEREFIEDGGHFSDDENLPPLSTIVRPKAWEVICEDYKSGEEKLVNTDEGDGLEKSSSVQLDSERADGPELLGEITNNLEQRLRKRKRSRRKMEKYPSWHSTRATRPSSSSQDQASRSKIFRATGELLRGAADIKRHAADGETPAELLGQLEKICAKVKTDGVVKGDDYIFNQEGEYDVPYYPRRVMGSAKSGKLLVLWDQWNFTHCTEEPPKNLSHSKILVEQYIEYEKGIAAIKENLEATPWYSQLKSKPDFTRIRLPYTQLEISDKELKEEMKKEEFLKKIGYWCVKAVEIEWMEVLDPQSKFSVPPLYLESMSARLTMWKHLPMIQFIKKYEYSEQAEAVLISKVRNPHLCVFSDWPEARCRDCRDRRELILTSTSTVDLTEIEDDSKYFHIVCCHERSCSCVGGWKSCQRWLPTYPRKVPLVVFFDIRYNGWGVRALTDIPRGTIVSEYVGEVISKKEAESRVTSYQMGLRAVVIDAFNKGNESRFFGHSCNPNMVFCPVYVRGFDMSKQYRNVLITTREIKAGADMTLDYHPGLRKRPKSNFSKCRCGSANCRGWL